MYYLDKISKIFTGLNYISKDLNTSELSVILLQGKDIQNNYLNKENLFKVNRMGLDDSQILTNKDVLFSAKGNRNFAFHYNGELGEAVASSTFFVIRITSDHVLPEYLSWYLNSKPAQDFFKANTHGTFIPSIPKSKLIELKIPIPDLKTQKTIALIENQQMLERELLKQISTKRTLLINEIIHNKILRKK